MNPVFVSSLSQELSSPDQSAELQNRTMFWKIPRFCGGTQLSALFKVTRFCSLYLLVPEPAGPEPVCQNLLME